MFNRVPEITVQELKTLIDEGNAPTLVDVRQRQEYAVANLNGLLIPLQELPNRLNELEPFKDSMTVVYCRSGARSAQAVAYMRAMGFDNVLNLRGGIIAWSREIDPTMPTY